MRWRRLASLLMANFLAVAATAAPRIPTLLSDHAFVAIQGSNSSGCVLNNLDLISGVLTPIGHIGFDVTALAFSNTGVLFGVDPAQDLLVRIDISQGTGIAVGPLGIDVIELPGSDLTFDGDNNLWMIATVDDTRGLFLVDQHSGNAERIGPIEFPFAGALAADSDGLYAAEYSLGLINLANGTVNPIGEEGLWPFQPRWMSFGSGSVLWAIAVCGVCAVPWDVTDLVTVDLDLGVIVYLDIGWLWGSADIRGLAINSDRRPQMVEPVMVD